MKQVVALVAFFALMLWFAFGHPVNDVAKVIWAQSAAPWENVVGFYYPNKNDHTQDMKTQSSGTLAQCRDWAQVTIAGSVDPTSQDSDYICGIGCANVNDITTCRTQLK